MALGLDVESPEHQVRCFLDLFWHESERDCIRVLPLKLFAVSLELWQNVSFAPYVHSDFDSNRHQILFVLPDAFSCVLHDFEELVLLLWLDLSAPGFFNPRDFRCTFIDLGR